MLQTNQEQHILRVIFNICTYIRKATTQQIACWKNQSDQKRKKTITRSTQVKKHSLPPAFGGESFFVGSTVSTVKHFFLLGYAPLAKFTLGISPSHNGPREARHCCCLPLPGSSPPSPRKSPWAGCCCILAPWSALLLLWASAPSPPGSRSEAMKRLLLHTYHWSEA